jgi:two-component system chemotaxis response regulator CheB
VVATSNGSGSVHTVAVGASAGGIEALRNLVGALPVDLSAAILVVLHLPPNGTSVLPQILARAGALPAEQAVDGTPIEGGHIYVAPPDVHLLVEDGRIVLGHGPRSNGHRPAIDPLFRTVADAYGAAGAGVVLSGVLDDGTAGLMAIKRAGGRTLVQDPGEALYDMMPRTAIEVVAPDHIGTAEQLGRIIGEIAQGNPPQPVRAHAPTVASDHLVEVDRGASDDPQPGALTGLTCPACNGAIWFSDEGGIARFACRTGHDFSIETFASAQSDRVEAALFTALRTLEERAALYRRMAARHRESGNTRTAERFSLRAESAVQHAFVLREVIEQFDGSREHEGAA